MQRLFATVLILSVLVAACGEEGENPAAAISPTATATATSTPLPTPTFAPPFTTPAARPIQVPYTVQLVDLAGGEVHMLYQHDKVSAYGVGFSGAVVRFYAGGDASEFDLDGERTGTGPIAVPTCQDVPGAKRCSPASPDGRWLPYQTETGEHTYPNGDTVPTFDQWVLDVRSGESRLLQQGLVPCGACHGGWAPRWSPSRRFVAYDESGGQDRRWLSDLVSGSTVQIGNGFDAPVWSTVEDHILYRTSNGGAMFHDAVAGTVRELPLAWPATFDASGQFAYSPAWYSHVSEHKDPDAPEPRTTVLDLETGLVVSTFAGAPPGYAHFWETSPTVAATNRGLIVALQGADACEGTAIYVNAVLDRCVEGGVEARIAPNGVVAIARVARAIGHVEGAWGGSVEGLEFAIDIILPDGSVRTVLDGAISLHVPPNLTWNEAGTHLLVEWPRFTAF